MLALFKTGVPIAELLRAMHGKTACDRRAQSLLRDRRHRTLKAWLAYEGGLGDSERRDL